MNRKNLSSYKTGMITGGIWGMFALHISSLLKEYLVISWIFGFPYHFVRDILNMEAMGPIAWLIMIIVGAIIGVIIESVLTKGGKK